MTCVRLSPCSAVLKVAVEGRAGEGYSQQKSLLTYTRAAPEHLYFASEIVKLNVEDLML